MYEYSALVTSVHDGDTLGVTIDLGFHVFTRYNLRLYGVNAPELNTDAGKASLVWVKAWLNTYAPDGRIIITTLKGAEFEKYGRFLGKVTAGGLSLNDDIVAANMAVVYLP